MMARKFTAQIKEWSELTERKMQAILRQSVQDVGDIAQKPYAQGGPMPVDLSTLRNSLATQLNGAFVAESEDSYLLGIARMAPGDYLRMGWTAAYARRRNYEPVNGRSFRDEAAMQWTQIVERNVNKVRNR